MSGVPPPIRATPSVSHANPPVLIEFVSQVPAPVTRLLVEQAGTIKALRRAAEIASWRSPKVSESWIMLAVWWALCGSVHFGVRYLVPLVIISPAVWRYLKSQTWWPWRGTNGSARPHEPVAASDVTVAATISDITILRLLLPAFVFTPTPVPSHSPILDALRLSQKTLPFKALLRATGILYIPYLLLTHFVPLPIIFGLVGTILLTARAPWICVLRGLVAESGWAKWTGRRMWAFLTGQAVSVPGASFKLQERAVTGKSPLPKAGKKKANLVEGLKPAKLRFRFDILENQRWWVGIDWTSALLPNERTSWCSPAPHLAPLSPPINFSLPPPTTHIDKALKIRRRAFWHWDDPEWTVLVKTSPSAHSSRVHLPLPDVSSDSEGRLAKGLKRVGESLPESASSLSLNRRSIDAGDDERDEVAPGSPSALKDQLTDSDGWVYADNKWEAPSPKGGLGKYTRYRVWTRSAVLVEEIEELEDETSATTTTDLTQSENTSPVTDKAPLTASTHHNHYKGHKQTASEGGASTGTRRASIGQSSSVSDRESRLTSRLKSVLESRSGTKA